MGDVHSGAVRTGDDLANLITCHRNERQILARSYVQNLYSAALAGKAVHRR